MEKKSHSTVLPPLKTLFSDSWEMFKGSLLNLFIINVIAFGAYLGLFVIGLLLALPLGLFSIISAIGTPKLYGVFLSSLGGLGLVVLLFLVACMIVGYAFQAASILVVGRYKTKPQIGKTIKQGFPFILPLFLAGLLTGFLSSGGYFLFIVPGVIIQILLSFVIYEIILGKKSVLAAARHSMGIVMAHFWGVFGRMLLWVCIVLALSILPNAMMSSRGGNGMSGIFSILNILVGWYGLSYAITLYNQARHGEEHATKNLLWPIVIAIIGWIIAVIMLIAIASLIPLVISNIMSQPKTPVPTNMYRVQALPTP